MRHDQVENSAIKRLDKLRETSPHAKFAHLFKVRTVNPFTLKVFNALYDARLARAKTATTN